MNPLPTEPLTLARQRIGVEFVARREAFGRELRRIQGEFGFRNTLHSSMYVVAARELIKQEYQVRAELAWLILSRVVTAARLAPSAELGAQCKEEVRGALETCTDLKDADAKAQAMLRGGNWPDHFELKHHAISRAESEIDLVFFAAQQPAPSGTPNVTIINPVGIVQTGANSSAVIHQNIAADDRVTIERALAALRSELQASTEVVGPVREQVLEVLADAESEVRAPQPNMVRLRGAMSALATTVQTLGSVRGAYELLKGAAALIGLPLP